MRSVGRPKGKKATVYATFRLVAEIGVLWETLASHLGLSKTATIALALKRLAAAEKITLEVTTEGNEKHIKTRHGGNILQSVTVANTLGVEDEEA